MDDQRKPGRLDDVLGTADKITDLIRREMPGLDPESVAAAMVRAVDQLYPIVKLDGKTLADQPRIECVRALMRRAPGPIADLTWDGHWENPQDSEGRDDERP